MKYLTIDATRRPDNTTGLNAYAQGMGLKSLPFALQDMLVVLRATVAEPIRIQIKTDRPNSTLTETLLHYSITHGCETEVVDTFTQDFCRIPAVMNAPKGYHQSPVNNRADYCTPVLTNRKNNNPKLRHRAEYENDSPVCCFAILKQEHARLYGQAAQLREQANEEANYRDMLRAEPFDIDDAELLHYQSRFLRVTRRLFPLYCAAYNLDSVVHPTAPRAVELIAFMWADAYGVSVSGLADQLQVVYYLAAGIKPDFEHILRVEERLRRGD